jgi:hypothetical protein
MLQLCACAVVIADKEALRPRGGHVWCSSAYCLWLLYDNLKNRFLKKCEYFLKDNFKQRHVAAVRMRSCHSGKGIIEA